MTKMHCGENFLMEANTEKETQRKTGGKWSTMLCGLLMALFMMGTMSSCGDFNPIDKVKSLLGEAVEEVDEGSEDEGEGEGYVGTATTTDVDEPETPAVNEPEEVLVENLSIEQKDFSLMEGQTKQLTAVAQPMPHDEGIFWKSSDETIATVDEETGVVKAVKAGSANIIAQTSSSMKSASVMVTVTPARNPNYGTVNLGYGTYTGDLKNGKPHGHGTIVYSTSHKVVNSADYYAVRGDKFEGDFRDGRISGGMGYFYHNGDVIGIQP